MTLRARLTLLLVGSVLLAVFVGSFSAQVSTGRELRGEVDQLLIDSADEIDNFLRNSPGNFNINRVPEDFEVRGGRPGRRGSFDSNSEVQLINSSGSIVASLGRNEMEIPVSEVDLRLAADRGRQEMRTEEIDGMRFRILTRSLEGGGAVQVSRSLGEVEAVLGGVQRRLLIVGLIIGAAAALVGWFVTRRITKPVLQLAEAAETVAATQDFSTPVSVGGTDEVGRLATSFNTMLEALRQSRAQQHDLVMDASHELRTPLTSLRTNIELLQRGKSLNDEQKDELLGASVAELEELTDLVSELVELATESRETEAVSEFDLVATTSSVAERVERRTGRQIEIKGDGTAMMLARPAMIDRAITNLIENAVKYSPEGSPVVAVVGSLSVQVQDRGPGIPDEDKGRIFDRFYRSTDTRSAPGSGLGLAIVKQTVDAHQGTVFVLDNPGGGAIVGFELAAACAVARS